MMIEFNPYTKTFADDPYPIYKRLRDEAPVYHCVPLNFWAISRYADVLEAHRDFKTFSSAGGVTIEGLDAMVPLLIVKDPPHQQALHTQSHGGTGALHPRAGHCATGCGRAAGGV
jgi:cytochrome P450